jgi:hypothetical protein
MTLRTEAGDSDIGSMRDRLREPSGSPLQIAFDNTAEDFASTVRQAQKPSELTISKTIRTQKPVLLNP